MLLESANVSNVPLTRESESLPLRFLSSFKILHFSIKK